MWRVEARYQTRCPRCRGYIKISAWIVQNPTYGRKWSHAVCPADARMRANRSGEGRAANDFKIGFGGDSKVTAREMTA